MFIDTQALDPDLISRFLSSSRLIFEFGDRNDRVVFAIGEQIGAAHIGNAIREYLPHLSQDVREFKGFKLLSGSEMLAACSTYKRTGKIIPKQGSELQKRTGESNPLRGDEQAKEHTNKPEAAPAQPSESGSLSRALLFDDLCIVHAGNKEYLESQARKLGFKKSSDKQFKSFLSAHRWRKWREASYYSGPETIIGVVTYKDQSKNCEFSFSEKSQKNAMREWLSLHDNKYQRSAITYDKGMPFYFVELENGRTIMVQIANAGFGLFSFYSFWR